MEDKNKTEAIFTAITHAENIVLTYATLEGKQVPVIAMVGENEEIFPLAIILDKDTAEKLVPDTGIGE